MSDVGGEDLDVWVVDRVDNGVAVLVEDESEIVVEVAAQLLGELAVEGAILHVPHGDLGEPVWSQATRQSEAEDDRRVAGQATLDELKKRDPGGDIVL